MKNEPARRASQGIGNRITNMDAALLKLMVCPLTRSPLTQEGDELVAAAPPGAGLRYPLRQGIPVLLVDEAKLPPGVATLADFKSRYAQYIPQ